jgi:hypothetical protein
MSKTMMTALGLAIAVGLAAQPRTAAAADLQVAPPQVRAEQYQACGPCGCLHVTYEYHRELKSTYGTGYDPRNFDTTEPYFYWGAMRAYPHFSCDTQDLQQ